MLFFLMIAHLITHETIRQCVHPPSQKGDASLIPSVDDLAHPGWVALMVSLRLKWSLRRLSVCFKTRDSDGLQRRWSGKRVYI